MKKIHGLLQFVLVVCFLLGLAPSVLNAATIDVMIVYDSSARSWVNSNGGMNAFAADAVARMNQAAANSNIDLTFRLVYAAEVSYTYSGDLGTDLTNIRAGAGNLSVVHQWRDTYGADLVAFLVDTGSAYGWVGSGYLLTSYSGQSAYAYTANAIRSVDISHVLTHEVGHNLGAHHSKYQASSPGPNSALNTYSAGWYFTGTNATAYHTIMAYNDQDGDGYADHMEAPLFSTPLLSYQGTISGNAADGDNARTIRQTMDVVAGYRSAIVDTTISPESANFGLSGGTGSITLTTYWLNSWTAMSTVSWITITSGTSGTGSGTVAYSVAANATGLDRTGMIIIMGKTFLVTQVGDPTIALSPGNASFAITGSSGSITVTAASSGFHWTATTNVSWITITSGNSGTGNGTVAYNVEANGTCSNRQGTITVAGATFTVTQVGNSVNCWTQKADLGGGTSRSDAVGFSIGNMGYIGTGFSLGNTKDLWEYNPITDSWTQKADFLTTGLRYEAVGFSIGNKGYIGTGNDYSLNLLQKDFWEYDPTLNTWTQKADFGGTARYGAVGFSIGNKGYIGTGDDWNSLYSDFWEYDPGTNAWTQKTNFGGTARHNAVGFSIGNKGYIGTGYGSSSELTDFWEYDPGTNAWTRKNNFGGTARYNAVGFSIGSKGYIGTGSNAKDFWEYDPALNSWTERTAFAGIGRWDAVGFSIGSKGYIGTGGGGGSFLVDFWEYNPGVVKADFNSDGHPDILWRNTSTGENTIWFMDGINVLGYGMLDTVNDQTWQIAGIADFDSDGKTDILWRHTSGWNVIWLMDGTTVKSSVTINTVTDTNWEIKGAGDFDGDGKPDILWKHNTGWYALWYMDGTTLLSGAYLPTLVSDPTWAVVGLGDFNSDGKTDILWRHSTTGMNIIWFMNGTTITSSVAINTVTDPNWQIVGTSDLNMDGKADILWKHSTGWYAVWYMDGSTLLSGAYLPAMMSDPNWQIVGR